MVESVTRPIEIRASAEVDFHVGERREQLDGPRLVAQPNKQLWSGEERERRALPVSALVPLRDPVRLGRLWQHGARGPWDRLTSSAHGRIGRIGRVLQPALALLLATLFATAVDPHIARLLTFRRSKRGVARARVAASAGAWLL
eukprot:5625331-Pleurochrysis_carterae.AAC.1